MFNTKTFLGKELRNELITEYNIPRISSWADMHYQEAIDNPEISDILYDIMMMDAGPEFEYSQKELELLAELLLNEFKDPIKKINDLKNHQVYIFNLRKLIEEISEKLPFESLEKIKEYLLVEDWDVTIIRLCNQILEHEIFISLDYYDRICRMGALIRIDPSVWLPLKNLVI